jgi:SAM-dependent methyltransferase
MADGGYDEGYLNSPCFWGHDPAAMVEEACALIRPASERLAIDLGCGEGKNAAAMAAAGFKVLAIDKSEAAVRNAITNHDADCITWLVSDLLAVCGPWERFQLAIATGSFHCLDTMAQVAQAIATLQRLTCGGGINVLYAFNDGPHDFGGHSASFRPLLLPHDWYLSQYASGWEVLRQSNLSQDDMHPHNNVPHHHSITRILARKLATLPS